jgi:hypothetical protein
MKNRKSRWLLVLGSFLAIAGSQISPVSAQSTTGGENSPNNASGGGGVTQAATGMGNVLNPAMNPYTNPYLMNSNVSPDVALMYMLQSQRANGGIGSGAMSGVRDLEEGKRTQPQKARTNQGRPGTRTTEGTSSYFQRGQGRFDAKAGSYFQRVDRRFDH